MVRPTILRLGCQLRPPVETWPRMGYDRKGSSGKPTVSAARAKLHEIADKLTEEDAAIVLTIARTLARRRKPKIPVEVPTRAEAAEIRQRQVEACSGTESFEDVCRELGY